MESKRRFVGKFTAVSLASLLSGCYSNRFLTDEEEDNTTKTARTTSGRTTSKTTSSEPTSVTTTETTYTTPTPHESHSVSLTLENDSGEKIRVRVVISDKDSGESVFTDRFQLSEREETTVKDALPAPERTPHKYSLEASVENGTTETLDFTVSNGSGLHRLNIDIDAKDEITIQQVVH